MVISNAHEGLRVGAHKGPGDGRQRCRVGFQRNLLAQVNGANKPVVSTVVKTDFAGKVRDWTDLRGRKVADNLRERSRGVAGLMDEATHNNLAHMAFGESLCSKQQVDARSCTTRPRTPPRCRARLMRWRSEMIDGAPGRFTRLPPCLVLWNEERAAPALSFFGPEIPEAFGPEIPEAVRDKPESPVCRETLGTY